MMLRLTNGTALRALVACLAGVAIAGIALAVVGALCKIVVIWRPPAFDLVGRNIWTPRRNFAASAAASISAVRFRHSTKSAARLPAALKTRRNSSAAALAARAAHGRAVS
jgi:hypothetical protein